MHLLGLNSSPFPFEVLAPFSELLLVNSLFAKHKFLTIISLRVETNILVVLEALRSYNMFL